MNLKQNVLATMAAVLLALATGAANAQIVVRIGPPPPRRVEVVPAPPRAHRDWVWVGGYHRWDGRRYVWVGGRYMRPSHPGAVWVPGEWRGERGGNVWHEGYWR